MCYLCKTFHAYYYVEKIDSSNKIAKIFNFFNILDLKLFSILTSINLFLHVNIND